MEKGASNSLLEAYKRHPTPLSNTQELVRFLKTTHEQYQATLDALFNVDADIKALLRQRALWLDEILTILWQHTQIDKESITLMALGGYGLCRIHPGSDADILLLSSTALDDKIQQKITQFITAVWDCGIKLGSSVRTLAECEMDAKADLHFYSNLLSMRFLCGDQNFFDQLKVKLPTLMTFDAFLLAKVAERHARYARFNNTEYGLEPNIKESPGGLRDLDLIVLLCLKKYQQADCQWLFNNSDIDELEYNSITSASLLLWRIRYQLHLLSQSKAERLYFEHQDKIADAFGITAKSMNDKINTFMQQYYQTVAELREITDILCQYFSEHTNQPHERVALTAYCDRIGDRLDITDYDFIRKQPDTLLQIFDLLAAHDDLIAFSAKSLRFIRVMAKQLPKERLYTMKGRQSFMAMINRYQGAFKACALMHRLGLLSLYIPQMATLSGQMQYDLFHLYTVDAHTLLVLRNCEWLFKDNALLSFALPFNAKEAIPSPQLLLLAGLLHDIGKGHGGNHSGKGAAIAKQFCEDHALSIVDTETVAWLVENHLLMSEVAQHQDIGDENVIERFSTVIKTQHQLCLLYLLTVADIFATNPSLWNHWRSALLRDLYLNTMESLQTLPASSKMDITSKKQQALTLLTQKKCAPSAVLTLWEQWNENYFHLENAQQIAWQTEAVLNAENAAFCVAIKPHRNEAGTDIFIYAPDNPYLFANVCATLEKCFLTIVQARISTTSGHMGLQSYVVLAEQGTPIHSSQQLQDIQVALSQLFTAPPLKLVTPVISRHVRRSLKFFSEKVTIVIENKPHSQQSLLILHAPDFPGLLARVAECLVQCNVTLNSAIINTLDAKVEDVFYVSDTATKRPLEDKVQIQSLKQAITHAITKNCM